MRKKIGISDLTNILLRELETQNILDLPPNFYEDVRILLNSLGEEVKNSKDDISTSIAQNNYFFVLKIVKKIFILRLIKALNLLNKGENPENIKKLLVKEENEIITLFLRKIDNITKIDDNPPKEEYKYYIAVRDFTQIMIGKKVYGPFKKGDIVLLPKQAVNSLEKEGIFTSFEAFPSLALERFKSLRDKRMKGVLSESA